MPLDDSAISNVRAARSGTDLLVTWDSTAPAGTIYQVYLDGDPVRHGTGLEARVPFPVHTTGRVDVFAVGPGESGVDFTATLPPPPWGHSRATLGWDGGTYLGDDIASYRVYSSAAPGGAVDLTAPVAVVTAYDQGVVDDGFGQGGFGGGGFGLAASSYSWRSDPLAPGVWSFQVHAVDDAGNESTAAAATVTVAGPPGPPALGPGGVRVTGAYDKATGRVTLSWNPPP